MEGNLWKTPGEELEPDWFGEDCGIFGYGSLEAGRRRAACEGERRLYVSEGEPKVRRAAYHWYTVSRVPLDDLVVIQDPGSLGRAGKANYPQPVAR
jgi:hypothetical protein